MPLSFLDASEREQREPRSGLELAHQSALRRDRAGLLERRLEMGQGTFRVGAIETELAQEFVGQEALALRAHVRRQGQRALEMRLRALELTPAPTQHSERQQGHRFALL